MKNTIITLALSTFALAAAGQDIEYDDMYFNAADRQKLRAAQQQVALAKNERIAKTDAEGNPTDSYSARGINPEYSARSSSKTARADEEDYYVSNYQRNLYEYNQWNNQFSNWYGNNWYRNNYWSPSIYGWNSPYYGSYYDAWGNPWVNPYFRTGWSASFSFHYGNAWNYGYGGRYFDPYYDPFFDPYFGYNSWWSPYRSAGYWGGGYWGYPGRVVVIENDDYRATYGKRNSRSSQLNRESRSGSNRSGIADGGRSGSTGRQYVDYNNSSRSRSSDRYVAPSRSSSTFDRSSSNSSNRPAWDTPRRSSSSPSPSYSPSQSRSSSPSFDSGGGSRSSSGSSSGGSSGGSRSSRGRGN